MQAKGVASREFWCMVWCGTIFLAIADRLHILIAFLKSIEINISLLKANVSSLK